ncbi:hypothetical protein SCHPADRAFT_910437 [Schizopora paradoxa]|uniref:Uncharacterized protein n=1 Tax=Schizopora paradoxa TaxID=27342 RepID=A0A0H2R9T8_9AGAM|nr:hypothetical protein SCHPADRAFT_910437 [Schizopora paradoxa]
MEDGGKESVVTTCREREEVCRDLAHATSNQYGNGEKVRNIHPRTSSVVRRRRPQTPACPAPRTVHHPSSPASHPSSILLRILSSARSSSSAPTALADLAKLNESGIRGGDGDDARSLSGVRCVGRRRHSSLEKCWKTSRVSRGRGRGAVDGGACCVRKVVVAGVEQVDVLKLRRRRPFVKSIFFPTRGIPRSRSPTHPLRREKRRDETRRAKDEVRGLLQ